jgi:hypothetical protein
MAFPANRRPAFGMQPQGANLPPSAQSAAYFQNQMAHARSQRSAVSFRVNPIVKFIFYVVVALLVTNQLSPNVRVSKAVIAEEGHGRPLYPLVVAGLFVLVFVTTKERARGEYFLYSWTYWILFSIGGFLGAYQLTAVFPYMVAVIILKLWIGAICIPWVAFRVISPDRLDFFQKYVIHVILFGAILCIAQIILPAFSKPDELEFFLSPLNGRGHGVWLSSNGCGIVLLTGLIFTALPKWKSRTYLFAVRSILTVGIFFTFSRMAITGMLLAFLIEGIFSGKPTRLIVGLAAALVCVFAFFTFANLVESGAIKLQGTDIANRVQRITSLLKGDVSEEADNDDRFLLWQESIRFIVERGGTIIGTGHGSMMSSAFGLDAHNAYITTWGNSGLLGLVATLGWYAGCFYLAWRIPNRDIRSALIAFSAIAMYRDLTAQNFLANEFAGVYMAIPALNFYYGLKQKQPVGYPVQPLIAA